ncbi:MAG: tetratricopeptide repeat protein [Sphingomonadaceae bacterium]
MNSSRITRSILPLGLAGAIAVALAAGAGVSTGAVARSTPDKTAAEAQKALAKGDAEKAITLAEGIVAANPREASYRALLGQAYLRAGRFESAVTSFNDAMKLGDNSAKSALSLSLAYVGAGHNSEAVGILNDWRDAIPASDLGLAYALAGETGRGTAILTDALRAGDKSPKLRQNLAYAFALDGRWREARLMAAQDVPADQLDARLSSWAAQARPEDSKLRVAGLLKVPMRADPGQPAALALNSSGDQQQLAVETGATRSAAPGAELPATGESAASLAQYRPVDAPAPAASEATPEAFSAQFASAEVVQPLPAVSPAPLAVARRPVRVAAAVAPAQPRAVAYRPRPAPVGVAGKGSTHAVQLGSFASEQGARRAWGYYAKKNPELRNYKMAISQATVRGKRFWRVAAAGLDGRGAGGLCSAVKSRGGVCFAYAVGSLRSAPVMARAVVRPAAAPALKGPAGPSNARKK